MPQPGSTASLPYVPKNEEQTMVGKTNVTYVRTNKEKLVLERPVQELLWGYKRRQIGFTSHVK